MGKRARIWDQMMAEVANGYNFTITDKGKPVAICVPYEDWVNLKRHLAEAEDRLERLPGQPLPEGFSAVLHQTKEAMPEDQWGQGDAVWPPDSETIAGEAHPT